MQWVYYGGYYTWLDVAGWETKYIYTWLQSWDFWSSHFHLCAGVTTFSEFLVLCFLFSFFFQTDNTKVTHLCRVRALRCLFTLVDCSTIEKMQETYTGDIKWAKFVTFFQCNSYSLTILPLCVTKTVSGRIFHHFLWNIKTWRTLQLNDISHHNQYRFILKVTARPKVFNSLALDNCFNCVIGQVPGPSTFCSLFLNF